MDQLSNIHETALTAH